MHQLTPVLRLDIIVFLLFTITVLQVAHAQIITVTMTAYSSEVRQTNSQPFITATGETVRPGIVAVSRDLLGGLLPYGTKLRVVEIQEDPTACGAWDPDMILEVQDTMHRRMHNRVDIWMPNRDLAIQWGICTVSLEILELPNKIVSNP